MRPLPPPNKEQHAQVGTLSAVYSNCCGLFCWKIMILQKKGNKIMKPIKLFCLLLAIFTSSALSQTINESIEITPVDIESIAQVNGTSYEFGSYDIGRMVSQGTVFIFRSYFEFNLVTIPDNATISQVQVYYSTSGSGYTFKLTKVPTVGPSLQANWTAIGNGTSLQTGVAYGSGNFPSNNIKSAVGEALGSNTLYIGALSEQEATDGSYSQITTFSLKIDYSYPAPPVQVTVLNDLDGATGGNIGVAVYPNSPVSRSSPYSFTAYVKNRLNLAAYDGQNVFERVWFFNDTECSGEQSEWRKRKGFVNQHLSNNASFTTPELTIDDDGASFVALLKTSSYTTNGTISANETWVCPATLQGNVVVPSGVTLTLSSDVNFNGYYIESTGGTIEIENGATVYIKSGNRFYGLFTSIQSALSAASSGQTVDVQPTAYNTSSSLQVNSGVTLLIRPNTTINLTSGASLNVNGTLTANGTSSNEITFDFTSPSSGNGIKFNSGSGGSLTYCNISNATYGVTCTGVLPVIESCAIRENTVGIVLNNVNTTGTTISDNDIKYNSGHGIWCNYSSVRIAGNDISINGDAGIYCIGSAPWVYDNFMNANDEGLLLINNSPARVYRYGGGQGLNFVVTGNIGIYADYQCNASVYGNDIIAYDSGDYAVRANWSAVVQATGNFWGGCPTNPDDFYTENGALIFWQPPECNPLTDWGGESAMNSSLAKAMHMVRKSAAASAGFNLDERLLVARRLQMEGKYEEAIALFVEVFREEKQLAPKQYILAQLAECYRLAGKNNFIDFVEREVRRNLLEDDELNATTLELENLFLISVGNYDHAIANFNTLKTRFARNDIFHKNALFGLGYILLCAT